MESARRSLQLLQQLGDVDGGIGENLFYKVVYRVYRCCHAQARQSTHQRSVTPKHLKHSVFAKDIQTLTEVFI